MMSSAVTRSIHPSRHALVIIALCAGVIAGCMHSEGDVAAATAVPGRVVEAAPVPNRTNPFTTVFSPSETAVYKLIGMLAGINGNSGGTCITPPLIRYSSGC